MAPARHTRAVDRATAQRTWRRRLIQLSVPAAGVAVLVGATLAAIVHDADATSASADAVAPKQTTATVSPQQAAKRDALAEDATEDPQITRSFERPALPTRSTPRARGSRLALTDGVSVRSGATTRSPVVEKLSRGQRVSITGRTDHGWTEVLRDGLVRFVRSSSLGTELPLGTEPCASGSEVEQGLQPDTIKVHRAVCARFPQIAQYGGVGGGGEHATGQALDIMVSSDLGSEIAAYLQQHRAELGIDYLIWRQQIWRPATSPGWRPMSDRGSPTANHMDHVHVTTYGSAATS